MTQFSLSQEGMSECFPVWACQPSGKAEEWAQFGSANELLRLIARFHLCLCCQISPHLGKIRGDVNFSFGCFQNFYFFSGYLNTPQKNIDPLMCSAYLTEGFSILTPCQRNNPLEINSNNPLENTVGKYTHQYSPMYFVLLKTWKQTKFYIIKFKFNNAYLLNLFKYRYYFTAVEITSIYEQCK